MPESRGLGESERSGTQPGFITEDDITVGDAEAPKPPEDDEETMLFKVLRVWPTFGLCNIAITHPSAGCRNKLLKLSAVMLLLAQIGIPVVLFLRKFSQYDSERCPQRADALERLMFFSIAALGFVRTLPKLSDGCREVFLAEPCCLNVPQKAEHELRMKSGVTQSRLNIYGQLDNFMAIGFVITVYMMNIWLAFLEEEPAEMMFSTLVMEFITRVDDEFKEAYFKHDAACVKEIAKKRTHKVPQINNCSHAIICCIPAISASIGAISSWFVPLACLGMAVYGTVCK